MTEEVIVGNFMWKTHCTLACRLEFFDDDHGHA